MSKENCELCGHNIAKRKVTFCSALASAALKAYLHAYETNAKFVKIRELNLTTSEYARMNDLVRFGLLYKNGEEAVNGEYGIPKERLHAFFNNKYTVSAHYLKNPITKENEMSEERIYFKDVPKVQDVIDKFGVKLTEYCN